MTGRSKEAKNLSSPLTSDKRNKNDKYYSVARGRKIGIFDNWASAEEQIRGFSCSLYQGFKTKRAAEEFLRKYGISDIKYYTGVTTVPGNDDAHSEISDDSLLAISNEGYSNSATVNNNAPQSLSSSMQDISKSSNSTPVSECKKCINLTALIETLIQKLEISQSLLKESMSRTSEATITAAVSDHINRQLSAFKDDIKTDINSRLSAIDDQLNKRALYSVAAKGTPGQPSNIHLNQQTPNSLKPPMYNITPAPPASISSQLRSSENRQDPSSKQKEKFQNSKPFIPERCLVISDLNKENLTNINQDSIRRTIGQEFGPTMFDMINRYKFNSSNPKYIIQLSNPDKLEHIVANWKPHLLGGSSIRRTLKPNPYVGMLRGVPTSISDEQLSTELYEKFPGASLYRLRSKEGTLLRTVKIEFSNKEQLNKSMSDGIILESEQVLLQVELPYSQTKTDNG